MSKIEYIKVSQLFGSLNHLIPLHDGGVTIVHGPNGCGKTTVLRLLNAIIAYDFKSIKDISFESIEVGFGNRRTIRVSKMGGRGEDIFGQKLPAKSNDKLFMAEDGDFVRVELLQDSNVINSEKLTVSSADEVYERLLRDPAIVSRIQPSLRQVGGRAWRDVHTGINYNTLEVSQRLADFLVEMPEWFIKEVSQFEMGLINTQRLLDISRQYAVPRSEERSSVRQFVEIYSEDIKAKINEALNKSAVVSQVRERSFPERIINKEYVAATNGSILEDYAKLQERFSRLAETGLQEEIPLIKIKQAKFNPTEKRVLALYLEDLNQKLNVFSELQDQVEAFKVIVGRKFRRKVISLDRNIGFSIKDDLGRPLAPGLLSSGEQHQIVMFYELIFSKKNNLLFLIDEPEISLHVEWQRQFLSDLEIISKLKGHQFLIATHSPQVIGARRDIAVALDGGVTRDGRGHTKEGRHD